MIWPSMQYSRSAAASPEYVSPGPTDRPGGCTSTARPPRISLKSAFIIELRVPMVPPSLDPSARCSRVLPLPLPLLLALPAEATLLRVAVPDADALGRVDSTISSTACVCSGMSGESETMSSNSRALPARRLGGAAASVAGAVRYGHNREGARQVSVRTTGVGLLRFLD